VLAVCLFGPVASVQAAVPRQFFGLCPWDSMPPSPTEFSTLSRGGVGTLRFQFFWPSIEPVEGSYDWSRYDTVVGNAAQAHIRVLPDLFGTPAFAGSRRENPPLSSWQARRAWKRFVAAVVRRYGPQGSFWNNKPYYLPVRTWEVWNEESSPAFWYQRVNAKPYAELLRMAHAAARAVDPNAQMLVGGIFPWPRKKGAIPAGQYLDDLYAIPKVKRWFEGVGLHPYAPSWKNIRDIVAARRHQMNRYGDSRTGIWITEFGWASGGNPSPYVKTPEGQAWQLKRVYRMLAYHRLDWRLRSVSWFTPRDRIREQGEPDWWGLHVGLFDATGSEKPAWDAYADVAGGTTTTSSSSPPPKPILPPILRSGG
jgi:hypothetical protein